MRNGLLGSLALLAFPVIGATAQTTRWNDRSGERWTDETPSVRVWFGNYTQQLRFGGAARVMFETDEDAYVVVGRVDSDGRMSILFPYNRTQRPFVKGGVTNVARSRRGGSAYSFVAYERWGMGFVFAIASYEPMDVSRLQTRDFASYDGVMNAISRRYYGNPSAVVERFAPWVLYDPDTPYDFDIQNYSVEPPSYASYASYCGGYGGAFRYSSLYDGMLDPAYCSHSMGYYAFACSGLVFGFTSLCYDPIWWRLGWGRGPIAGGNPPPVTPGTPGDKVPNTKLIPQIGNPSDPGTKQGTFKSTELNTRPTVGGTADDDELNRVYSIPRRALDDLRRQERIEERRPIGEITVGGGAGSPDNSHPTRRDFGIAPQGPGGRRDDSGRPAEPPPARRDWGRDRDVPTTPTTRGDPRPRPDFNPRYEPPRRELPRNFDPPRGNSDGRFDRGNAGSYSPPPRNFDPPPRSSQGDFRPAGGRPEGSSAPATVSHPAPPPPPPPPATREPAPASTEKKPHQN